MSFIVSLMTVFVLNFTPITSDPTPSSKVCVNQPIGDPEHWECIDPYGP